MDDLVEAILTTTGQLTVAALAGNAAARHGLMLALAADQASGAGLAAVLNPHYRLDGPARLGILDLHLFPAVQLGAREAARSPAACLPVRSHLRPAIRADRPGRSPPARPTTARR